MALARRVSEESEVRLPEKSKMINGQKSILYGKNEKLHQCSGTKLNPASNKLIRGLR